MKIRKGLHILAALSVLTAMVLSVGMLNNSVQAASEPAELDSYLTEQDLEPAVCTPDVDGMRAYWMFDDGLGATDFTDVIENPAFNNGDCVSDTCPTSTILGKVGFAFKFDGGDEILVTDTAGLDFTIGGDISVETWVRTTQDCTNRVVFVGRYEGFPLAAWWLGCDESSHAAFHMRDSAGVEITVRGTSAINDGLWHHVVGTRDGIANINKIYVDGVLEKSGTPAFTGTLDFTNKPVTIGYFAPSPFYWLEGTLDELALYDRPMTPEEISSHYLDGEGQSYCQEEVSINYISIPLLYNNN